MLMVALGQSCEDGAFGESALPNLSEGGALAESALTNDEWIFVAGGTRICKWLVRLHRRKPIAQP